MSPTPATTKRGEVGRWRGFLAEWVNWPTIFGALAGAAIGFWAAETRSLLNDEKTVLLAVLGAAVGVLAVALTAMTLVIAFLSDRFLGPLISDVGVRRFFAPFVSVSMVSAAAAIVSLVGAIDSATKAMRPRDILFGLSAALLTWAVLGAVRLVFKLVKWSETMEAITPPGQSRPGQAQALVEIPDMLERLLHAVEQQTPPR